MHKVGVAPMKLLIGKTALQEELLDDVRLLAQDVGRCRVRVEVDAVEVAHAAPVAVAGHVRILDLDIASAAVPAEPWLIAAKNQGALLVRAADELVDAR